MMYTAIITIELKKGMLDPEATAIRHALANLGFETGALSSARMFKIEIEAPDKESVQETASEMCERLLANPVIHSYSVEVRE